MRNASDVTLNTIPKLKKTSLRFAFVNVKELKMENAGLLERNGELMKWRIPDKRSREDKRKSGRDRRKKKEREERRRKERGRRSCGSEERTASC